MILYYTGTGNSAFAAKKIAYIVQDEWMNLFDRLKKKETQEIHSEKPFVIVCPTYGWRIPRILEEWLKAVPLTGNRHIYFVMTCGDGIGNAQKSLQILCQQKGMIMMGCAKIVMPENYIAMFAVPDQNEAVKIISQSLPLIEAAAQSIKTEQRLPDLKVSVLDRLCSSVVNGLFYPLFVHARKFYVKENCISCGKCVQVCPLNNIQLIEGKPVWQDQCTHCMACICHCPQAAIEYGEKSLGKPRYLCPQLPEQAENETA